jgi:hypothetical protein
MAIGPKEPSFPGNGLKSELTEINHDQADSPHDCIEVASEDSFPARATPQSWIPIIGAGTLEFGGGLEDIFHQMLHDGGYDALQTLTPQDSVLIV